MYNSNGCFPFILSFFLILGGISASDVGMGVVGFLLLIATAVMVGFTKLVYVSVDDDQLDELYDLDKEEGFRSTVKNFIRYCTPSLPMIGLGLVALGDTFNTPLIVAAFFMILIGLLGLCGRAYLSSTDKNRKNDK